MEELGEVVDIVAVAKRVGREMLRRRRRGLRRGRRERRWVGGMLRERWW